MGKSYLKRHIIRWSRSFLDQLLPPRCLSCGTGVQDAGRICPQCWERLEFLQGPACSCCGYPFGFDGGAVLCGVCLKQRPAFDRARAALRYDDGSRQMIISFKHGDRMDYADFFSQLLSTASQDFNLSSVYVIPVPLHKKRLRKRRYNQAALLAQKFAEKKGFDYIPDMLVRHRYTPPQEGNYGYRKRNVAGAFTVKEKYREIIRGGNIVVIDDVYTTGATAGACAQKLTQAGAATVTILTVARVC